MFRIIRSLSLACIALMSLSAAAEGYRSVRVELKEKEAVEIQLSKSLNTQFKDGYVTFVDGKGTKVEVPRTEVVRFTFLERDASAIDEVGVAAAPQFGGDCIVFTSLPAGSVVSVVNAAGRTVFSKKVQGDYTLSLGQFSSGVYMVTVNGVTYKVRIK